MRNFEWGLRLLLERGHRIHIAADVDEGRGEARIVEVLARDCPTVSYGLTPSRANAGWYEVARKLRLCIDYLRYLEPAYESAPRLLARAAWRTPHLFRVLTRVPILRAPSGRRWLGRCLDVLERAVPVDSRVVAFIREFRPEVVMITPLLELGSPQVEYVRVAKAQGARTALCVYSWDNLSSKGLIRDLPDLVTVWNGTQKTEAVEMHGVPPERVVVTGAQSFDHWFGWRPRSREEFVNLVGLSPSTPYVLYVGSALFRGTPPEPNFIWRWLDAIRSSEDGRIREVGVLVRPHPERLDEWRGVSLSRFGNAVVWPRRGANPIDTTSRANYYDSICHSAAVVGLNTSALIESGIIGRPVHTLLLPEFSESQGGTLHFRYLLEARGGLLQVGRSLEEHLSQLAASVGAASELPRPNREFVESFVRPYGIDVPASPVFAESIEALGKKGPAPPVALAHWWSYPIRALLYAANVRRLLRHRVDQSEAWRQ